MASSLAQTDTFKCVSMCHLQVGHTHEDIDGIFSVAAQAIKSAQNIETPRDLQRLFTQKVGPVFTTRDLAFSVEIVDSVTRFDVFSIS